MKPGTAIALVALFIALGGTGYAALKLPKNSVTTIQVKDRSLMARDFKPGQLPAGEDGKPGPLGPQGPAGQTGPAGISNIAQVNGGAVAMCGGGGGGCQVGGAQAACPAGQVAIAGGFITTGIDNVISWDARVNSTTWGVIAINYDSSAQTVTAQVICASGPGVTATAARASAFGDALARERATARAR